MFMKLGMLFITVFFQKPDVHLYFHDICLAILLSIYILPEVQNNFSRSKISHHLSTGRKNFQLPGDVFGKIREWLSHFDNCFDNHQADKGNSYNINT